MAATGVYTLANIGDENLNWGSLAKKDGKAIEDVGAANDLKDSNFAGTYNGVPGTFKEDSGAWTFTLDDPNATVSVKDEDFLAFGWWKEVPAKTEQQGRTSSRSRSAQTPTLAIRRQ